MDEQTRRTLLRRIAAGATLATAGATAADPASSESSDESDGPVRLLYSCDITTEDDPTPDVNDRISLRRVEGTFAPAKPTCFEEETTIHRYLFADLQRDQRGREGIAWATRKRLPRGVYRIATIFVCDDAPSGYCARKPFYGVAVRRVGESGGRGVEVGDSNETSPRRS
ncbi:hypothetical protein [Haladaptatus salinisoli]|uniref:hypothetical protein n=1 Tax=Haladaptatus salinisoli TaxID=2884876 RepID=UPI001D0AF2EA|nr:hypothetical protein [Haladaptatus salinisoli]